MPTVTVDSPATPDAILNVDESSNSPSSLSSSSTSRKKRQGYSLKYKKAFISKVDHLREPSPDLSLRAICDANGLPHNYYSRWKKDIKKADDAMMSPSHRGNITGETRCINQGKMSILEPFAQEIAQKMSHLRDRGLPVSTFRVTMEANKLSAEFKIKNPQAKKSIDKRFVKRLGFSHRRPTHQAQKHWRETELIAKYFMNMVIERCGGKPHFKVINMDQSPQTFSPVHGSTLQARGSRTVHVMSVGEKMRCTVNVTVTMSGEVLAPYIIFKGKEGGRIETKEFPTYPSGAHYGINKNAWCDSVQMQKWIQVVLKPWIFEGYETSAEVPVLILDAYSVHQMSTTVNAIEDLGCDVIIIPGGCTYLCQPADVGINRPIKMEMTRQWESFMEGVEGDNFPAPSRQMVAQWVINSFASLTTKTVKNAWRKKGFEWDI